VDSRRPRALGAAARHGRAKTDVLKVGCDTATAVQRGKTSGRVRGAPRGREISHPPSSACGRKGRTGSRRDAPPPGKGAHPRAYPDSEVGAAAVVEEACDLAGAKLSSMRSSHI
jgi:hypothetical protein